jgi:hypothetical protein
MIAFSSLARQNHQNASLSPFTLTTFSYSLKHSSQIDTLVIQLGTAFRIRNMGPIKHFLGMDIIRPNLHTIHVSHRNYAQRILAKFDVQNCNPTRTPFESIIPAKKALGDQPTDAEQFHAITGSIMHLTFYTHPDIMFASSKLAQFNSNPSMQHYRAAKHLLRYIQGTKDLVITFYRSPSSAFASASVSASASVPTSIHFVPSPKLAYVSFPYHLLALISEITLQSRFGFFMFPLVFVRIPMTLGAAYVATRGVRYYN